MNLFIVTGGSKGLGEALVNKALAENNYVLSISRSGHKPDKKKNGQLLEIKADLSKNFLAVEKKLNKALKKINFKKIENVYLVNNAGQIKPVAPVGKLDSSEVEKHIYLNYMAPVLMTNWLLAQKFKNSGYQVVAQISSGAAHFAIPSWSIYCSGKAALEMFNSVMQLQLTDVNENQKAVPIKNLKTKIKVFTYSPGIIDTGMQKTIRSLKTADFPDVARFKEYKDNNSLRSAKEVAEHLFKILETPEKITEKSYSLEL